MQLTDAIQLINHPQLALPGNRVWADLGAGSGLFTYALAAILPPGGTIFAIDKKNAILQQQPNPNNILIKQQTLNFITDDLAINNLDGILMANSLHFVKDKMSLLSKLEKKFNVDKGCFLMVEYDTDVSNPWVPYPVSFNSMERLFKKAGYDDIEKIWERPSAFGRSRIYGAYVSKKTAT